MKQHSDHNVEINRKSLNCEMKKKSCFVLLMLGKGVSRVLHHPQLPMCTTKTILTFIDNKVMQFFLTNSYQSCVAIAPEINKQS